MVIPSVRKSQNFLELASSSLTLQVQMDSFQTILLAISASLTSTSETNYIPTNQDGGDGGDGSGGGGTTGMCVAFKNDPNAQGLVDSDGGDGGGSGTTGLCTVA